MGEYAIYNGERVKIGTCENMYYLRYCDRAKVIALSGNVDTVKDAAELRFRLPFPDEDGIYPGGNYAVFERSVILQNWQPEDIAELPAGKMTLANGSGICMCVSCYHGNKIPENCQTDHAWFLAKLSSFELKFVWPKRDSKIQGIIRCRWCNDCWYEDLDKLAPFVENAELRRRLEAYCGIQQPAATPTAPQEQPQVEQVKPALVALPQLPPSTDKGATYEKNGVMYHVGDKVVYNHIHSFNNEFCGVIVEIRRAKNGMRVAIRDGNELVRCAAYSIIRKGEDAKGVDMYYN